MRKIFRWFQEPTPATTLTSDHPTPWVCTDPKPLSADETWERLPTLPKSKLPHKAPRDALIDGIITRNVKRTPLPAQQSSTSKNSFGTIKQPHEGRPHGGGPHGGEPLKANPKTSSASTTAADLTNVTSLEQLREAMENFSGCPLKDLAQNMVFSDGNPRAPVMFVGEAPGADEDAQGRPFVGLSGQLLDRMLKAIHLNRSQVYIANILPWRPPGNRQPTSTEIAMCLPFIRKHIQLIRPKVLVFLGGTSAKSLLGTTEGIMRLRGRWLPYDGGESPHPSSASSDPQALATFHPAYLLRSPGQKRQAWQDFLMISKRYKEILKDSSSDAF